MRDLAAGQVEMKRVGIPAHVPCAVQQWEGLIAGNLPVQPPAINSLQVQLSILLSALRTTNSPAWFGTAKKVVSKALSS